MGREEKFKSTGFMPAHICWLTYILIALGFALLHFVPQHPNRWWNGFITSILTTLLCFGFAYGWKNTSIYDPYWCWYPLFNAAGWMATASSAPSARGWMCLGLIVVWLVRYNSQWIWEGWFTGIHTEDWRYPLMAKNLGLSDSTGPLYWILCSLIGAHIIPTLLVWSVLGPVEAVWTAGSNGPPLGVLDFVGAAVSLSGIALQFVSDRTLRIFRENNIQGKTDKALETQVCSRTCRDGPWGYSRHPNYLGEVLFWLGMDLASVSGGWVGFAWAFGGIINYTLFFRVSSSLMDKRSLTNRPGYRQVMDETSALVPCPLAVDRIIDRLLVGTPEEPPKSDATKGGATKGQGISAAKKPEGGARKRASTPEAPRKVAED